MIVTTEMKMRILFVICVLFMNDVKTESMCPSICTCLGAFVDCSNKHLREIPKNLPTWIESLDMSSNQLHNNISLDFSEYNLLTELKLNKNSLTVIPVQRVLQNLTDLRLSHNKISTFSSSTLELLPNLKTLDLSNNHVEYLMLGMFPNGSSISVLNLNNNRIVNIEKGSLDGLSKMSELKLKRNNIQHLNKEIFKYLTNLKILELNRNSFTEIEGLSFHGLEGLTVLKMRQNSIHDLLDGAFFGLQNLITLDLDYNNISEVSKGWLYGLGSLHHLSLSHNRIQKLDGVWEFCLQLTDLDLSYNQLLSIEKGTLEYLSKLQRLRLDNNQILYIEEGAFNYTPSLKILELNNNKISWTVEDMQGAFTGLKRLTKLGLAGNLITSISEKAFDGLDNLAELDLSGNAIKTIHSNAFSMMPQLRVFMLNTSSLLCDCSLRWFPVWLIEARVKVENVLCAYPEHLKGRHITEIAHDDFLCSRFDFPKPYITIDPASLVALAGSNVNLSCRATSTSNTLMSFKWRRNNQDLENSSITEDVGSNGDQVSYLHLNNVTLDHSAKYQCVVTNEFGTAYSRKADLSVFVFPVLVKSPVNVTAKAGNTARLACSATGHPPPQIAWQKDGGNDFPAAQERRMHVMPTDDVFFIVNVKAVDTGVYSCTAKNEAGFVVANASLTVLEPPSFSKKMEDKEVRVGEAIVLECKASGSPKPKLHWNKDGHNLIVTDRHFFSAEKQLLIIMDAVVGDAGVYTCEMTNSLGTSKGETHLTVLPIYGSGVNDEDITGVIIITVVCCAVGTSFVWVIIIYQTRKRLSTSVPAQEIVVQTKTFHLDTKSEHSSSSKDSGTGDSTKRSHEDLLLGTAVGCIHQFNEETESTPAAAPEVTLPLLTSFHPYGETSGSTYKEGFPSPVIVPCCHTVARSKLLCSPTAETSENCVVCPESEQNTQRTDHERHHPNSYLCVYIPSRNQQH